MEAGILFGQLFVAFGDGGHERLKVANPRAQPRQFVLLLANQLPVASLLFGSRALMPGEDLAKSADLAVLFRHGALVPSLHFGDLLIAASQLHRQKFEFGELASQLGEFRIAFPEPHQ